MSVELNHTIVFVKDKRASAAFLAGILGLRPAPQWAGFIPVQMSNGVTLDFADADEISGQHYAFLVGQRGEIKPAEAALAQIGGEAGGRPAIVLEKGGVGIDLPREAFAQDKFRMRQVESAMKFRAFCALNAVIGPQRLLAVIER